MLASADVAVILGAKELLHAAREAPAFGGSISALFPQSFMGGWGSAAAIIVGLVFAGSYGSEEGWASPGAVFKGAAFGSALAMWQSIDSFGLVWTVLRWAAVAGTVGLAIAIVRHGLAIIVLRYRFAAGPSDRVILVGDPESDAGRGALKALRRRPGMHSLGWLSEQVGVGDYLGHPSAVWEALCETGTDTVVLCGELAPGIFDTVVEAAAVAGCRVLAVRSRGTLMASQPRALNGPGLRMLELTFPVGRAGQDGVKRTFDVIVSVGLLLLLSPTMLLLSLWIKIDSKGPVLFVQDRVGQAGTLFRMMKFRTMDDGADREKEDLAHLNSSGDPRLFKIPDDPRVTRVGSFLRRWSLDEFPQLWNVVRGEMSLVGPRPFFQADLTAYDDHHFLRLTVKPGVTGLWQVKGRSSILDFEQVVNLDREYIENWSFGLDLRILLSTLPAVVGRTGAF